MTGVGVCVYQYILLTQQYAYCGSPCLGWEQLNGIRTADEVC